MQCSIHVGLPSGSVSQKIIPEMEGRNSWWAFISGRPESEWNPPKKSKTQKQRCQSRGMRAFSDDSRGLEGPSAQTYRLNEEGEIELATASEAEGFLPTPSGTPAPESGPSTAEQESSTALPNAPSHAHKPREPTPLLLKPIDHVSFLSNFLEILCLCGPRRPEICITSTHVFHPLDKPSFGTTTRSGLPYHRNTCTMDIRSSIPGRRPRFRR